MATYQSVYTGAQIDAGIAYATPYAYSTYLGYPTLKTGTFTNAGDLIAAIKAQAPLQFQIGSAADPYTTFYCADEAEPVSGTVQANYIATTNGSLEAIIYKMYLTNSGTSVTWSLDDITVPVPDSTDAGKVLVASSTDGEYELGGTIPIAATNAVAGVVKLGSSTIQTVAPNAVTATESRTYAVQTDSNGQMMVNVPWTSTSVYDYSTALGYPTTTSGTFTSASDLVTAITAKQPISFILSNGDSPLVFTHTQSGQQDAIYTSVSQDIEPTTYIMVLTPVNAANVTWSLSQVTIPSPVASTDAGQVLMASSTNGEYELGNPATIAVTTSAPTAANTNGLKVAVLSTDPQDKYSGWLYIITGA